MFSPPSDRRHPSWTKDRFLLRPLVLRFPWPASPRRCRGRDTPTRASIMMMPMAPSPDLTVVMTSDEKSPSGRTGRRDDINALMAGIVETMRETARDGP